MGSEAVLALMEAKPDSEAVVVTLEYNAAVRVPLVKFEEKVDGGNVLKFCCPSFRWTV